MISKGKTFENVYIYMGMCFSLRFIKDFFMTKNTIIEKYEFKSY